MEQVVFDSSYLLKPTTFLEDLSFTFDIFKDRLFIYLITLIAAIHPLK